MFSFQAIMCLLSSSPDEKKNEMKSGKTLGSTLNSVGQYQQRIHSFLVYWYKPALPPGSLWKLRVL